MSQHWKPEGDRANWLSADAYAPADSKSWPAGATAGLVLVAAACLAVGAILYQVAGPRDVIEEDAARR